MAVGRRLVLAAVPAALAAVVPARVWADDDDDDDDDKKKKARAPRPAPPPQPASRSVAIAPPLSLTARSGSEQMVSDPIRITGHEGTGAGPIQLDVEGARAAASYQVLYVPQSNPGMGVILGTVRTDPSGAFKGTAPEPLPAIAEAGRLGVVVFRRLIS